MYLGAYCVHIVQSFLSLPGFLILTFPFYYMKDLPFCVVRVHMAHDMDTFSAVCLSVTLVLFSITSEVQVVDLLKPYMLNEVC